MKQLIRSLARLHRSQKGITGLETAIILIAFVVVASVFAYTVLSAGIFSSQKGKESINAGLQTAQSSLALTGSVIARDTGSDNDIDQIILTVVNALDGEPINLATTTDADADGILSDEATKSHVLNITYVSETQRVSDVAWTKTQIGRGDSDDLLEAGEKFEITVDLTAVTPVLGAYGTFTLELKPPKGSTLIVKRTIPSVVDDFMDLK